MPIAQSYLRFLVAIEIRVTTQIMLSLHCYEYLILETNYNKQRDLFYLKSLPS